MTGFRIFIDGKQLKTVSTSITTNPESHLSPHSAAHEQLHEIRLRLPVVRKRLGQGPDGPHRINVGCLSRSGSMGPLSSPVEVSTIPFRPFVHFCNFLSKPNCHPTPPPGSTPDDVISHCRFIDVFRRDVAVRRYFSNRTLPPIEVNMALDSPVFDLATRRTLFLRTLGKGNTALIVAVFVEASVCAASSRMLSMLADFASALEGLQPQASLVAIYHHHNQVHPNNPTELPSTTRSKSAQSFKTRRLKRSSSVQPMPNNSDLASSAKPVAGFSLLTSVECDVMAAPSDSARRQSDLPAKRLCELVRVAGVPTLMILNGETGTVSISFLFTNFK